MVELFLFCIFTMSNNKTNIMKTLRVALTNKIINNSGKLYSFDECIGAMLIASPLEREGIIYTYIKWVYDKGEVHINNKLYEVSAFDVLNNPFDMTMQRPTFMNKLFPKKITLKFVCIE